MVLNPRSKPVRVRNMKVDSWAELEIYKQSFALQQQIFEVTKS